MASNVPSNAAPSKVSSAAQLSSPGLAQGPSSTGQAHQQRAGGSGSFGAGATSRSASTPRNKQGSRTQHKNSKRARLGDEDAIAESHAMRSLNSRKGQTSITHLMNFSLPPRPTYQSHRDPHRSLARRNPTWGMGSGYHSVDKARYVHANYRFIVDPGQDYYAQSVDADTYLDWNNVLQILASPQSQSAACPICLGEPVAPRMAKCGHLFCLHCLIRYIHVAESEADHIPEKKPRWKKCPLCWDSIYISETRPVKWHLGQEGPVPHEGSDIVLRLVMRPAGSTLALPKELAHSSANSSSIPWHFAADVMDYARVMKGSEDYMNKCFDDEISALERLEKHDELMYGEDTEWTGRAIRSIHASKDKIKGLGNPPATIQKPEEPKSKKNAAVDEREHDDGGVKLDALPASGAAASALSTSFAQFKAANSHSPPPSDYYFYQALLHYYLSPLDIRILKVAFGDFSNFPTTILPRIERISTGHVVDDELRKRAKYLSHLPYGCEISFLECDWTDTVDATTLAKFAPEIEKRRKRNVEKETREEKERARAEREEENKRYAGIRQAGQASEPVEVFKPNDFAPLGTSVEASSIIDESLPASASPPWGSRRNQGSAFASLASPSTSPHQTRTVWGTAAVAPTELSPTLQAGHEGPPMDDGWLQGWEKELMAEDELVAQVTAASLADAATPSSSSSIAHAMSGPSGQRKKKGKKITLMSTTVRRGA